MVLSPGSLSSSYASSSADLGPRLVPVVDGLMRGPPLQVGRYEYGEQQSDGQQSGHRHVSRHVSRGAEYPAVDGGQDKADQLRAAVEQPAGRAFRHRVRQLDCQLVADRQVPGHERPAHGRVTRDVIGFVVWRRVGCGFQGEEVRVRICV